MSLEDFGKYIINWVQLLGGDETDSGGIAVKSGRAVPDGAQDKEDTGLNQDSKVSFILVGTAA